MTPEEQLKILKRGTVEIIQENELLEKLRKKKQLVVKAGFDPTAPDLHLGHTVLLRKLRHFQDLGHKVIFLIGDATALVGDPSGQTATRKRMTWEEVLKNAATYEEQVGKILKREAPLFERRHNSEWFARRVHQTPPFAFEQFVELASKYTIARILERDDFQKRLKENKPISYLETFYPLMQGYDSVMLKSDVELGGTDQKFNLLVGRELQKEYRQEPQVIITTPLLEGLDGVQKMSKSLGNHVGIEDPPKEMFGKMMSLSDALMWKYYELLTNEDVAKAKKLHPMEAKKRLARLIVANYHGEEAAEEVLFEFVKAFQRGEFPEVSLTEWSGDTSLIEFLSAPSGGDLGSKTYVRRKMKEGAILVNGEKIKDLAYQFQEGEEYQIRVGKKFLKVRISQRT